MNRAAALVQDGVGALRRDSFLVAPKLPAAVTDVDVAIDAFDGAADLRRPSFDALAPAANPISQVGDLVKGMISGERGPATAPAAAQAADYELNA